MNAPQPSLDTVFELLANQRRRYILYYLDEIETPVVRLDDLTDQLVEWERDWENRDTNDTADHWETVRIDLHHSQLPRLANANFIDYDARTETIRNWDDPAIDQWAQAAEAELQRLRILFGDGREN